MEKAGILVNQECYRLKGENLSKLKSTFVNNINCFIQKGSFTACDKVLLEESVNLNHICEGDTVVVELKYYDNEKEKIELTLFDGECDILNDEISIDSPLGSAIYHKEIGETTSYLIKDSRVYVTILKKLT